MKSREHRRSSGASIAPFAALLVIVGACGGGVELPGGVTGDPPFTVGSIGGPDVAAPTPDIQPATPDAEAPSPCEPSCPAGACGDDGCGGYCSCSVLTPFCFVGWCQEAPPPKEPTLEVTPTLVDFGLVPLGESLDRAITLKCVSNAPVQITHFAIAGDGAFVVLQDTYRWRSPSGTEITVELLEPWVLEPGQEREVGVRYTPIAEAPGVATVRLLSDDASAPDGHLVELRGGPPVGCAAWEPGAIEFGATVFGTASGHGVTLSNCGTLDLSVDEVSIAGDGPGAFALQGSPPQALAPGESWSGTVTYSPTVGSVGAAGTLEAQVSFEGGSAVATLALSGFVVLKDCPVAHIAVGEDPPAPPGTVLHLSAAESYAPDGEITDWYWGVEQPLGGVATFSPGINFETPTFPAAVVGLYRFDLSVFDADGTPACAMASAFFKVVPEASLYVELTWATPGDIDPTDQGAAAGADLDLHLAHPSAAGTDLDGDGDPEPWFDPTWDCYWFNGDPDWGPFQPPTDDDPHLIVEDVDGSGPEAIAFDLPEIDATYRLAVHAWSDHGFGPSAATVRIYLLGTLLYESDPIPLETGDLWEVADITWLGWPDAQVIPVTAGDGGPVIFPSAGP